MTRRGHDADAGQRLRLAVELLDGGAGEVDHRGQIGEVVGRACVFDLVALGEDRHAREVMVPARMVGVEVTVRDELDVPCRDAVTPEDLGDRREVERAVLGDRAPVGERAARIEEEEPARMLDEERRHDDPIAREPLVLGRHRVVAGVERLDP